MVIAEEVARLLLRVKAVRIDTENLFTYTSGIKSPIYCDNRVLISFVRERAFVTRALAEAARSVPEGTHVDVVAGVATAGIPFAAWVAHRLRKPMIYVRGDTKKHGTQQRIEGVLKPGKRVLVVEDLITTGASAVSCIRAIRAAGAHVDQCCAVFTYELAVAKQRFLAENVSAYALSSISTLLDVAVSDHQISPQQRSVVEKWLASTGREGQHT